MPAHESETMPDHLITAKSRSIAYHLTEGTHPMVVFLGGLRSDMAGTKAVFLEEYAKSRGGLFCGLIILAMAKAAARSPRAVLAIGPKTQRRF